MPANINIAGREIGPDGPPYIIAELSGNHNGDIGRAFEIMKSARDAGADAVKLQTYTADILTIDHNGPGFTVDLPLWKNRTLYDLYQEAHTPWDWHEALFAKGKELGITVFSSPFDFTSVDFLETLDCPAYKIASSELVDTPLIKKAALTGKPIIISTGMATLEEIEDAVTAAKEANCRELILLHCVAAYPAPPEQASLANIQALAQKFDVITGLSDHTPGTVVPVAAVAMGARVIEKHFTLSRADGGVDSSFSLEPAELQRLVEETHIATAACTGPDFGPKESERAGLEYRRSLYVVEDIKAGDVFSEKNIRSIRPGHGLKPKHYESILGKKSTSDIKRGEPMNWKFVEGAEE